MALDILDGTGTSKNLSTTLDGSGNLVGSTCLTDPLTGNKVTVAQLHNADKQNLSGGSQYGALGSSTGILIDPFGLSDRQREVGSDNVTSIGIGADGCMIVSEIAVNSGTGAVGAAGPATITPASMFGAFSLPSGGQGWSIQVGTPILYDVGGANQELVIVTAVNNTTFTATFVQTHAAGVAMLVRVYSQSKSAAGLPGVQAVSTEGRRATFRYCLLALAPVATPTDVIVIKGSATATVRIKRIKISGQATAQGSMPVQLVRRTTAGTLGSAVLTAITAGKHNSNDPAATATVSSVGTANYTTLGTSAGGLLGVGRLGMAALGTGTAGQGQELVWDFSTRNDKSLELRGTSDFVCINFNGAAVPSGGVLDIEIESEEDNS